MRQRLTLAVCFCVTLVASAVHAQRPNVLFIAVDDLRVELGCYGGAHVKSPNIDRLASGGTLFERAYCQQTVCNPSRASLLTGMRPDTLRVWDLPTHFRQNKPDAVTLPQLFNRSGYHAQCVGKIFHNWRQDDWKGDSVSWSVPSVLHYNSHGNDKPKVQGRLPPNLASGKGGTECRDVPDNAYFDGRVADSAISALRTVSQGETPFFLAVGFWKPHTPFNAPKKYWDLYESKKIPVPKHVTPPDDVPDIAMTSSRYSGGGDSEELREMHHGHLAAISYLDAQVGRVLSELDALGLRENTIVVFWSDHGLHLGEHGLTRKTTAFELDARVPLIVATPMHEGGQRTDALVELLDLYPTLADLCGLDAPSELEGVSLRPLLEDPGGDVKAVALTQTPRPNYPRGKLPQVMGYSIRTDRYRYTEWRDFRTGEVQARELYDHDRDSLETTNLANREKYQAIVAELARTLDRQVAATSSHALTPNIVYIISDDQAWTDFGFMGNQRVHTPNLDALARRSARFVHGYVPSSVCRPSLATLLTGLYPHQHGIHFNHGPPGNAGYNRMTSREQYERTRGREFALIRSLDTLGGVLRRQRGYRCLQTGKFWEGHWRSGGFTEGMTTFEPPPIEQTFGGLRTLAGGQRVAHGNGDAGLQIGRLTMTPIYQFIDDCHAESTPWMVWYAPYLPHQPHDSPQKFYDLARNRPDVAEHELPYFASIAQFDDTVGNLVRYVENKGLADTTLFVFVSDNGWRPSRNREKRRPQEFAHTKTSKRAPFDDGLRTPILIRWDGVVKPATHEGLASSIDLMPTILAAAGIEPPSGNGLPGGRASLPGVNLLPAARGESEIDTDRAIFGEVYPGDASSLGHPERDIAYRWVRQGRMKLIVPHSHQQEQKPWNGYLDQIALFDVGADPAETNNLAKSPAQSKNIVGLQKLLDDWWTP